MLVEEAINTKYVEYHAKISKCTQITSDLRIVYHHSLEEYTKRSQSLCVFVSVFMFVF